MNKTFVLMTILAAFFATLNAWAVINWDFNTIDKGGLCGEYPSAVMNSSGNFLVSTFSNGKLMLLTSRNVEGSIMWSKEIVDGTTLVGEFCTIALGPNDYPVIAYFDIQYADLKVARYNGTQWLIYRVDADDTSSGRGNSIAVAPDGNPAVAYNHTEPGGGVIQLRYAWFDGNVWHKEIIPSAKPSNVCAPSLKFAADGFPAIAYAETSSAGQIYYLKSDGASWTATCVDNTVGGALYPSLTFNANGLPGIAYYITKSNDYWSYYDLRYAYYNGAQWTHEVVDTGRISSDTGYFPSLKFNADNYPCISYFEWGQATSLQYARYTGTRWYLETPPQEGMIGLYSSLVFDQNGDANVFAFEIENNTLVWAKRTETLVTSSSSK
jgi:hypothetical protein